MSRKYISLNRGWLYTDDFKEEYINKDFNDSLFQLVNLPHANKEVSYNYFDEKSYQFISCYRKKVLISSEEKEKLIYLDFEVVNFFLHIR